MREYILYPESENKLKASGLIAKIKAVDRYDDNFPSTHNILSKQEFQYCIKEIEEKGYFKTPPKKEYKEALNKFYKDGGKWKLVKNGKKIEEEAEDRSFMLFSGYMASFFLSQEEFWNNEKFGFENIYDFFGSLGAAYIDSRSYKENKGHSWQHQLQDGRIFFSEVKGNMHGDLEITREELTPYETFDPLGNKVNYRQVLQSDIQDIMSHHSVEDGLLATLLTYIKQEKIASLFTNKEFTIKFLKELKVDTRQPLYADFGDRMHDPKIFFMETLPIPAWEERSLTKEGRYIPSQSGSYGIFIEKNKNLIFAYMGGNADTYKEGDRKAEFAPEEIDHLVKGLFIQAARQLGRTSAGQLVEVLDYWYKNILV